MSGVFACPECGQELDVEGYSPGREVQCEECLTWVEVPFLRRNSGWKDGRRSTRRSPWLESKTLRGAIVFAAVALLGLAATQMIGGRVRSDKEQVLAELLRSTDEAEASKRFDVALREIEGALAQARSIDPKGSERLVELKCRRDRLSLQEAEARLDEVETLDPDHAVGESLTIAERARHDPRSNLWPGRSRPNSKARGVGRPRPTSRSPAVLLNPAGTPRHSPPPSGCTTAPRNSPITSESRTRRKPERSSKPPSFAPAWPYHPSPVDSTSVRPKSTPRPSNDIESRHSRPEAISPSPDVPPGPRSGTRKLRSRRPSRSSRAGRSFTSNRRTGSPRSMEPSS